MAQQVSDIWKMLLTTAGTVREYQFDIAGTIYGPEAEVEHSVKSSLYDEFGIGNAACAQLSMSLYADNIPKGAEIKRYVRLRNGDDVSEWLPKGVFYTNRRSVEDGYWTIEAFDAMRKADIVWIPEQSDRFPMDMLTAVLEFVWLMGIELDDRVVPAINQEYTIDYPANDYTIRDELRFIAAAQGGNWIITDEGKLYLVPLLSIPPETNYLVEDYGDVITFGGVRILV